MTDYEYDAESTEYQVCSQCEELQEFLWEIVKRLRQFDDPKQNNGSLPHYLQLRMNLLRARDSALGGLQSHQREHERTEQNE